ncbi:Nuclear pore complex protein NUP160 [Rhynchospora pubera]|uniref:Nuclear pore complex protein NUP160 n=1 Tax=Rhynchospora pubera TaxID=906938 RepID=A0AAV8FFW3_9POAL|nr:Nuclear pore complex protein NUP160 [Rhynchospora pubera]
MASSTSTSAAAKPVAGVEVSIPGSDKLDWISLTVPSSSPPSPSPLSSHTVGSRDLAGCHIIKDDPQSYIVWRFHKSIPNALELFDVSPSKEFPSSGLRLVFKDALYPFAFLYKNEVKSGSTTTYSLVTVAVSGFAYLCDIHSPSSYSPGSTFPANDTLEISIRSNASLGEITAVTATPGCLVIGRQDGSISCYQLGKIDPNSPGFSYELRDDAVIGRILRNFVSRVRGAGAVKDIAISDVHGRKLIFSIHEDNALHVWDLLNRMRLLCLNLTPYQPQGANLSRLCVGSIDMDKDLIHIAILYHSASEQERNGITVYSFDLNTEEKMLFSHEPSSFDVPLGEGKAIDIKMSSSKLWILKQVGSISYELIDLDCDTESSSVYKLQEETVGEQLFQDSDDADLIWTSDALCSFLKDEALNFLSSIFLRRLIQPGVYQSLALRETFLDYKKFLSESQFQSLSLTGIRKEIVGIIEREGANKNLNLSVYNWRKFCSQFFQHWRENNLPYGLLLDSNSGAFGLIRKGSLSLFRPLESAEQLAFGSSESVVSHLSDTSIEPQVLVEVLACIKSISHHLGWVGHAFYQESLISSIVSSEDIISQLVKFLEAGFGPSSPASLVTIFGSDAYLAKRQSAQKNQRKFMVEILLSLHNLRSSATSWGAALVAVERYLQCLRPQKLNARNIELKSGYGLNYSVMVQVMSQVARKMFESAFNIHLFLAYLVNISGQVSLTQADVAKIKLHLFPLVEEILVQWALVLYAGATPTTRPPLEDFSSQLSSLQIGDADKFSLRKRLGYIYFTQACLLDFPSLDGGRDSLSSSILNLTDLIDLTRKFISSILWGTDSECTASIFSGLITHLTPNLVRHGQYEAAENLLGIVDTYSRNKRASQREQVSDSEWCARLHLRGFCLLMLANAELDSGLKDQKTHESIRCFFRAASGQEAPQILQNFSSETGFHHTGEGESVAVWRVHYYQWAMHLFEQYSISEGACRFALAALEQVDTIAEDEFSEPMSTVRGRLWANVFKCSLDLKRYGDAYSAIISNPDQDNKFICLRRFVIVLCEIGATKILCDGEIPFVGLVNRVEKELFSKAERADLSSKPNLYKVLYAFEAQRNNWRKAAAFMYRYSVRIKKELDLQMGEAPYSNSRISSAFQDRLHALSSAINALQLVDRAHAWFDVSPNEACARVSPLKKPRNGCAENYISDLKPEQQGTQYCVDLDALEKEIVITSAQYMLSLRDSKFKLSGSQTLSNFVDVLIHENLHEAAFNVILKFWKGSAMERELESAFVSMAQNCCPGTTRKESSRSNVRSALLLLSAEDRMDDSMEDSPVAFQFKGSGQWEALEYHLENYRKLHPRLPVVVAETLLHTDPYIELPLWLVHIFKGGRNAKSWGMTGQESDAATLFRLYINYGRYTEATNLLLEYLESYALSRPGDVINRKRMSAVWFPYTAVQQLWCDLEEMQSAGHGVEQCSQLKKLLSQSLVAHLKQIKLDSEDVLSSRPRQEM